MNRKRYQNGVVDLKQRKRGPAVWVYRHYEPVAGGGRKRVSVVLGDKNKIPTRTAAKKEAAARRMSINGDTADAYGTTFSEIIARYREEELPARFSTAAAYTANLRNHIEPKWGRYLLSEIKPLAVEQWLKQLPLSPKSRSHIRNLMRLVFDCAVRWGLADDNPIRLVRVKGASKPKSQRRVLTVAEFTSLLSFILKEPQRTMVLLAMCLGLRISELSALQWGDIDWGHGTLTIQRAIVQGRVDEVKTLYSKALLPLHPEIVRVLRTWHEKTIFRKNTDWVFASALKSGEGPINGWNIQTLVIKPAALKAGLGSGIGWHTFRHSYSTLLRALEVDVKVQQDLMRHADVRTTMNTYTHRVPDKLREANSKLVEFVLPTTELPVQ